MKLGEKFGRWTVVKAAAPYHEPGGRTRRVWTCRCTCGTVGDVREDNLRSGGSESCGCARVDAVREACFKHGHTWKDGKTHFSPEYVAWRDMRKRCYVASVDSFPLYGGKKIKVHPEWFDSFEAFLRDVGLRPAEGMYLRRLSKKRGYEPGNVRWDTAKSTMLKKSDQRLVTIEGVTKQLIEWADEYKIRKNTLHWRLDHWPPHRWLEPPAPRGKRTAKFPKEARP